LRCQEIEFYQKTERKGGEEEKIHFFSSLNFIKTMVKDLGRPWFSSIAYYLSPVSAEGKQPG